MTTVQPSHAPADRATPGRGGPALADLVLAVAGGDARALEDLYRRTRGLVQELALRLTGDHASAEDVVVDVFTNVWSSAPSFDPARGPALTWLVAIARHRALDLHRRREVRRRKEEEAVPSAVAVNASPGEHVEAAELSERLARALAELPLDQRRAVELAYDPGCTHAEIARRLDVPLGTVKTRIRLGLAKLRERLAPQEISP